MGNRGKLGFWVVCSVLGSTLFSPAASAGGLSSLYGLFAAAQMGIINRYEDSGYVSKLGLDPNASVLIQYPGHLCGATFLSDEMALTAAHCVVDTDPTGGVNVDGIESLDVYFSSSVEEQLQAAQSAWLAGTLKEHLREMVMKAKPDPQFEGEDRLVYLRRVLSESMSNDFAIVRFPRGTGTLLGIKKYPKLAEQAPAQGQTAYVVGHGVSNVLTAEDLVKHDYKDEVQDRGAGVKGWGKVTLSNAIKNFHWSTEEYVSMKTPSKTESGGAVVAPGDSGSLLFDEFGNGIGITVAMLTQPDETVTSEEREFLGWLRVDVSVKVQHGWTMGSGFASVHSDHFKEAMQRAECEWETSEEEAAFPKSYLRTGLFQMAPEKGKTQFRAHGSYSGAFLTSVTLREVKNGKARDGEHFDCGLASSVCMNLKDGRILTVDGSSFSLANLDGTVATYTRE